MKKEQQYLIYLINCAVKNLEAQLPDSPFNWGIFAEYAEEQQFEHIIFPLLKDNKPEIAPKIWHHLHQRYGRVIVKDSEQDMTLFEICEALSGAGIQHVPLKGSVIKHYYPLPDLRRSIDFDILVRESDMKRATEVLKGIGFIPDLLDETVHDTLNRGKMHIELHKQLVAPESLAYKMCSEVWDHVYKKENCTYYLTEEFLYMYLLEHLRKHLIFSGGAGIKLIIDFYILRNMIKLDEHKLNYFLEKANMTNFNKYVVLLEKKWFEGCNSDEPNVGIMENLILNSGAYGAYDTYVKFQVADSAKAGNNKFVRFMQYIFPPVEFLKGKYKILETKPYLLPVMWVVRLATARKGRGVAVIRAMGNYDSNEAKILNDFRKDVLR